MKKSTIALLLLSGLLSGCAPARPVPSPATSRPPASTRSSTLARTPTPAFTPTPTTPPGLRSLLQRTAQQGGGLRGITVVADLAYVGMGPRVAAIDLSQREHPALVGQSAPLPGLVTQLVQVPGGATPHLLVNAGRYLLLMDISQPGEPEPVDQLELGGVIAAMVLDEQQGILYAGGPVAEAQAGFISAVRISPDNKLSLMNSVAMPQGRFLSITLGNEGLYAGLEGADTGLYYVQLKNPGELSTPRLVIASDPLAILHPTSLQVIRRWLYLSYMDIVAFDVSDPDVPTHIWGYWGSGERRVVDDFILAGDRAYVFGWTILNEYVREVLPLPERVVGAPMGQRASVLAMHNGDFLVAYYDLEIFDTSDPKTLKLVGSYQPPVTNAIGAAASGWAVYVLDDGMRDGSSNAVLRAFIWPDLKPLGQATAEFPTGWSHGFRSISLDDDLLYLASSDGVWVYGVGHIRPYLLGRVAVVDGEVQAIAAVSLGGKRLLAISQVSKDSSNTLTLYDLTDLQKPARLGDPLTLEKGHTLGLVWNGSALDVLLDTSYHSDRDVLYVVNVGQDGLALKESLGLLGDIGNMAVHHESIVITGTEEATGRPFFSMLATGPLRFLSQTILPGDQKGVAMSGEQVLVVVSGPGGAQLLVYSVRDPAHPSQLQALEVPSSNIHVVPVLVSGPHVVLADGEAGVEVFGNGR